MSNANTARVNRLGAETSPYLLQHQHNPVDWHAWGEEAFETARREGKAVFLSVGYSTCYWCHVMERQCFENEEIAAEMNRRFVNIKVDREERPDVDQLYMAAVQVMARQGGWPMSVFMTPEGRPFYGGTYFPPTDAHGRPGFPKLLVALDEAWRERKGEVEQTADRMLGILHQLALPRAAEADITFDLAKIEEYVTRSVSDYEAVHGGFGRAPKFPRQTLLKVLLKYLEAPADATLARRVRGMLSHTLDEMDRGGIHDHLGGGFHRYSTDARWLVPHFEIMLYDQAMLAEVYAVAARVLGEERWAQVARGICDFVLREMRSADGAFHTAMDAEVDHQEGLNYLWTAEEISGLLGAEDAALFGCVYGVDQGPNFADPHHGDGTPRANILFLDRTLDRAAHDHGIELDELRRRLAGMRGKLKAVRDGRKQPLLDTKVITGWNALMSQALAVCATELGEARYAEAAAANCRFLLQSHKMEQGGYYRQSRGGTAKHAGFLDDYAGLALACLLAGRAAGDEALVAAATELAAETVVRFSNESCSHKGEVTSCAGCRSGALYFTDDRSDDLIVRQKTATDSPLPSGNSQALVLLTELGYMQRASAIIGELAQVVEDSAEGMSAMVEGVLRFGRKFGWPTVRGSGKATAEIESPERMARSVVRIGAEQLSEHEIEIILSVAEGYHLHAPDARQYTPTRLEIEGARVTYPSARLARFEFADDPVPVLDGEVRFAVRFDTNPGPRILGALTYQACSDSACLPQVTVPIEIHV
jgi:uncharacterized protein